MIYMLGDSVNFMFWGLYIKMQKFPRKLDNMYVQQCSLDVCLSAQSIVHGDVLSEKLISPHTGP